MYKIQKKGFTLIELLVVIAIIGILASIVYASLSTARGKARDAHRAEAVKTLKAALEVYQNTYGHYPAASTSDGTGTSITTLTTTLITENNNNYMSEIPQDPKYKNTSNDYQYVRGSENSYGIRVTREVTDREQIGTLILQMATGEIPPDLKYDLNGSGTITSADALLYNQATASGWCVSGVKINPAWWNGLGTLAECPF